MRVDVLMSSLTPKILEMVIILDMVGFYFLWMKFFNQFFEVLFRHHSILWSSEEMCLERQLTKMIQTVIMRFFFSINFHILFFSIVEPFHSSISVTVDPLQDIVWWGSSRLVGKHDSKVWAWNFVFLTETTKHSNEKHDDVGVKFTVIDHYSHCFREEFWQNENSLQTQQIAKLHQLQLINNFEDFMIVQVLKRNSCSESDETCYLFMKMLMNTHSKNELSWALRMSDID